MEEYEKLPNDQLVKMMGILSDNHEKIKKEIFILHETLLNIEKDYTDIAEELKTRL